MKLVAVLLLAGAVLAASPIVDAAAAAPLHALLITGGCCHDYEAQKKILVEGISARANVRWTVVHEGATPAHRMSVYENPDWAQGYDVIVHNECCAQVNDAALVERIAAPHRTGVPAVMLHCSALSYRDAPTDAWRRVLGIKSLRHERRRDLLVTPMNLAHPVMAGFPTEWLVKQDELYRNDFIWPGVIPLAQAFGEETQREHVVIWVNLHGTGRTFATTLGHGRSTFESAVFLDLVTRGLLWACGKLSPDGAPMIGYGAGPGD